MSFLAVLLHSIVEANFEMKKKRCYVWIILIQMGVGYWMVWRFRTRFIPVYDYHHVYHVLKPVFCVTSC